MAETMFATGRKPATAWKIALGIALLLVAAANNTKPTTGGTAGALGALTGLAILLFVGARLIASGLPRTLGNDEFKKTRRNIWYKLMGVGFVVMVIVMLALAFASQAIAAVLVTWLYWFGWTWISWHIAGKRALRQLGEQTPLRTVT
jgi:hypothetical protein